MDNYADRMFTKIFAEVQKFLFGPSGRVGRTAGGEKGRAGRSKKKNKEDGHIFKEL